MKDFLEITKNVVAIGATVTGSVIGYNKYIKDAPSVDLNADKNSDSKEWVDRTINPSSEEGDGLEKMQRKASASVLKMSDQAESNADTNDEDNSSQQIVVPARSESSNNTELKGSTSETPPEGNTSGFNTVSVTNSGFNTASTNASSDDNSSVGESDQYSSLEVSAVVFRDQSIDPGSSIQLRIMKEVVINGRSIPRNTVFVGSTSLNDDRLEVHVSEIDGVKVDLKAYDLDNGSGINLGGVSKRKSNIQVSDRYELVLR